MGDGTGNPKDRRYRFLGKSSAARSGGRPSRQQDTWQRRERDKAADPEAFLLFNRVALTAIAAGAALGAIVWFFWPKTSVPLVMAFVSDYGPPLGPLALAAEDRDVLKGLGRNRSNLGRGTVRPYDVTGSEPVDRIQLRDAICRQVSSIRGGGPGAAAIVYVSCIGGVDRDGKACLVPSRLPPGQPGDVDRSWLRVTDLVEEIANLERRPSSMLLVLDACRPAQGEPLGILDGGFAAAVAADIGGSAPPGLWVIVPASAAETACAAAPESVSVFLGTFIDAIEGCADADGNGRVAIQELATYLAEEVNRRATLRHGRRQTPFLVPAPAAKEAALGLSWAVRSRPDTWIASADVATAGARAWIDDHWRRLPAMRMRGIAERPEDWARFRQALVRGERLAQGTVADRRELKALQSDAEQLAERVARPLVQGDFLPGIRLAEVAAEPVGEGPADEAWTRALQSWGRPPSPGEPAPPPPPPADTGAWRLRVRRAWREAVARITRGEVVDRDGWRGWEDLLAGGPKSDRSGAAWPFESQVARLLARGADGEAWKRDAGGFGRVIALADAAAIAAFPADVRADVLVGQAAPRKSFDDRRRAAFDAAAVGDPDSLAAAKKLAAEAAKGYGEVAALGDEVSAAWRLLDRVRADLPWLALWHRSLATIAAESAASSASGNLDWQALLEGTGRLEDALMAPPTGAAAERLAAIREAVAAARPPFEALELAYTETCRRLADSSADNGTTLAEVRAVLAVPLVAGQDRERLMERERAIAAALAAKGVGGDAVRDDGGMVHRPHRIDASAAGWVLRQGAAGLVDPFVAALLPKARQFPEPGSAADVARAHAAWGQELRDTAGQSADIALAGAGEAAASRRLAVLHAGLAGNLPATTPCAEFHRDRWRDRLVTAAGDIVADFLGGCERSDPVWFRAAAAACLDAGDRLASAATRDPRPERLRAQLAEFEGAADRWADLVNDPGRVNAGDQGGSTAVTTAVAIADGVKAWAPAGAAAVWLTPGLPEESLAIAPADAAAGQAASTRVAVPVAQSDADGRPKPARWRVLPLAVPRLRDADRNVLDLTAWFRGHRIAAALPVVKDGAGVPIVWQRREPGVTRITVSGRDRTRGHVSFIFDCSGSMAAGNRMGTGRKAFEDLIDALASSGAWEASLWLYAHRAGWNAQGQVVFSNLANRQKPPAGLVPGNDVQQIQRMAVMNGAAARGVRQTLATVDPHGETPLYRAIRDALAGDAPAVPPSEAWRVVVVTDGVNDVFDPVGQVTAADVREALAQVNRQRAKPVSVDAIAFGLAVAPKDQAAFDELKQLIAHSGGRLRDAKDGKGLLAELRKLLDLVRWDAANGTGGAQAAELGQFIDLDPGTYAVKLEGRPQTQARVVLEGGEIVELVNAGADRPLEHTRYTGGDEQGIRDFQENLEDPGDASLKWYVGAHVPRRVGDRVEFPVSLQNNDETGFSPRPRELWVEVKPVGGTRPFVFVDPDFEPSRPVPVLNLTVPAWPRTAREAEISVWFSPRRIDSAETIGIAELDAGAARDFRFPEKLPGTVFGVSLELKDDRGRLIVEERHEAARDLPKLRLRVEPACERAVHTVDDAAGTVRHEFDIPLMKGRVPDKAVLSIVKRDDLMEHCVKPAAPGGRREPLRVAVPAR